MAEQQDGLRFDIYERVYLSEGFAEIRELNEIELTPHIQVQTYDDQAVLRGSLLLVGKYVTGDENTDIQALEHAIPIEITLPMNRIRNVEEISVEIENFDIDLLSSRSLNVTGVLSLHGIEVISPAAESWQQEKEAVFVHRKEAGTAQHEEQENSVGRLLSEEPVQGEAEVQHEEQEQYNAVRTDNVGLTRFDKVGEQSTGLARGSEETKQDVIEEQFEEMAPVTEAVRVEITTEIQQEAKPERNEPKQPQKKAAIEPKGKEQIVMEQPAGEQSVTEQKSNKQVKAQVEVEFKPKVEAALTESAEKADKQENSQTSGDESEEGITADSLEWKKLFLHSKEEGQEFKRIKMCIVQKDETIGEIADRYKMKEKEIILYNRLDEQELAAGQVIYIP